MGEQLVQGRYSVASDRFEPLVARHRIYPYTTASHM